MSKQGWEDADFPILCETCLGDNPYLRMTKDKFGKECKICARPFTVFKWCPGAGMRHKKTEICQTCAKIKNVCQTCVLDLEFGLPVQVRDAVLNVEEQMPRSNVNLEYFVQKAESQLGATDTLVKSGKAESVARETLRKMARTEPFYKRNRAHICSFYVKGECKRGAECPYRHELPVENEMSHQNIKDRFFGHKDPVANKILHQMEKKGDFKPVDPNVSSICITGIDDTISDPDLRNLFYAYVAFINFLARQSAEMAMEKSFNGLIVKGRPLRVQWGKSKAKGGASGVSSATGANTAAVSKHTMVRSANEEEKEVEVEDMPEIPAPPGADDTQYASENPYLLGTSAKTYRA
ncbi:hypothetical protein BC829DRAFT_403583 [Chytridium lagenaria]|nr:hypothetical protein BC829DRAFT_403583 [Chytridium lagenaria]